MAVSIAVIGGALAAVPAAAAAPTCTPAKPVVVGSGADRLTVTVPGCSSDAGLTGYRLFILATGASSPAGQIDVGVGTTQTEVTGLQAGTLYRFRLAARNGDGIGPSGPASTDAAPPFTTTSAMVNRQYLDFNGAAATSAQRSTWLADLASGAKTPVGLVDAAEAFPYWQKQSPVIRLFQAYFLRLPDKSGLAYWTGKSRAGKKITEISGEFARSSEFTRRYGTLTNRKFVEQIYLNVLGRTGDATGINSWTAKLDAKTKTRGQVMVGFSESSEYIRKTKEQVWTVNFFTGMLLRLPTTAEVATWKPQTRDALIAFLLGTPAYVARVGVAAPPAAPGITTTSLPDGRVGNAYSASLAATGGTGSLAWSVASGSLPPGLGLSGSQITGTPSTAGTSTVTLKVTDASGRSSQRTFSITVTSFSITTTSLPTGVINTPYSVTLAAAGGSGALTWSLQAGTLPAGLTLSTSGVLSGTPTAGSTATLTFKVTDATNATALRTLGLTISTFGITTASVPNGTVGVAYSATIDAPGGDGTLFWEISAGALPDGLFLGDGTISGTPSKGGSFTFTVRVTDESNAVRTRAFTITVPALAVTTTSVPAGVINTAYPSTQLTAANVYGTPVWTVSAGSLPAGLSLSSEGAITGTPTTGGTSNFTVKVTDDGGSSATKALTVDVSSFAITTTSVPAGYVGVPYAFALESAGGTGTSWSITAGSLPAGLTLTAGTGRISGTPTGVSSPTFTAKVDASGGKTASKQFTLPVTAAADWPQAGHDETGRAWSPSDGAIDSSNVAGIGEEWAVAGGLQPSIVGNLVYAAGGVPGRDGTYAAMALDLSTGEVVWYGPSLPDGCNGGPVAVTATAVLVQCGRLLAYDRSGSHALLWDTAVTDPGTSTQSMLVVGTTAIAWGSDRVLGYRLSDGERLWQQLLPSGADGIDDVAASGSSVVVAYSDRLRALSTTTGAQQWTRSMARPGEVIVADGWAYTRSGGGVSRFALASGTPGWSVLADTGIYQLVGADADTIYAFEAQFNEFGQVSSVLRALKASDGGQRWEAPLGTRIRDAGITKDLVWILESQIYAWGRDSNMIAFSRTDGVERKRLHFEDNSYGTAAFANGHVVFGQGGSFGGPDPARLRSYGFTPPAPTITTKMVPTGRTGTAYSATLEAAGGAGSLTWSLASGTLPAGLSLSAGGVLSGTPSAAAASRIQVRVVDGKGRARTRLLHVQVIGAATDSWNAEGRGYSRDSWNQGETVIGRGTAAQLGYRWKTAIPVGTEAYGVSDRSPVVIGTRVYDIDSIGRLSAWNTGGTSKTVAPAWTFTATGENTTYPDSPTESGGVLYILDSVGYLDAIRASDGVRLWHVDVGSRTTQRNELLVADGKVLLQDVNYDLRAYNTSNGSPAWGGTAVPIDGNELSGSLVIPTDGTRAFVLANCEVKAVTLATGAVAWTVPVKAGGSTNCGTVTRHAPLYADGAVVASTYDGSIAIEAATGAVRWRTGTKAGYAAGGGAAANGVWVLDTGAYDDPNLVAMSLATGEVLWSVGDAGPSEGLAIAGDLIVGRGTYTLTGYDLLTGEKIWDGGTPDTSSSTNGAPSIAGGRIYLSTRDGVKAYGLP
ncbi:putative Ig domain-containing protein [Aquihabitans daechungensis]|uniref:putative Ig domain-containing protein n=1 Tax=Aquihabitans daechungensis TaxID=1052257 RepID=UPI003B9F089C